MHELVAIECAGKHAEFDHTVGEELFEIDHPASASIGCVGFSCRIAVAFHLANQRANVIAERVAVAVQVASSARLPIEAHGMPTCDVSKLATKLAHGLRVIRADDRFDSDGDVASTRGVHVRPDGIRPFDKLNEMFDTLAADKMGETNSQASRPGRVMMEPSRSAFQWAPLKVGAVIGMLVFISVPERTVVPT